MAQAALGRRVVNAPQDLGGDLADRKHHVGDALARDCAGHSPDHARLLVLHHHLSA